MAREATRRRRPHGDDAHENATAGDEGQRAFRKRHSDEGRKDRAEEGTRESDADGTGKRRLPRTAKSPSGRGLPTSRARANACTQNRTAER
mmetsp:Transcript_58782/g.124818  ORF Transcript_58782/g.124818 Transcript_58782/m.124818 type:complete len:91 (-) Transcript_58782:27-299(-)